MAWLAQAEALRQTAPDLPVEALENYWRQRGWTALRVLELEVAQAALTQSLAVIESAPAAFSAVRRAEAQLLLADVELLRGQAAAAQSALAKAQPVLFTEYAPGHSERVGVLLIEVRLLLAAGDARAALATLDSISDQLRDWERGSADDSQHQDAQVARALRAQALAVLDDCPAALGLLAGPEPALLLNRRAIWQSAHSAVASLCRHPASTPPSG